MVICKYPKTIIGQRHPVQLVLACISAESRATVTDAVAR